MLFLSLQSTPHLFLLDTFDFHELFRKSHSQSHQKLLFLGWILLSLSPPPGIFPETGLQKKRKKKKPLRAFSTHGRLFTRHNCLSSTWNSSPLSQEQNQGDRGFKIPTGSSALLTWETKRKVRRKTIKKNPRGVWYLCLIYTFHVLPTKILKEEEFFLKTADEHPVIQKTPP